MFLFSDYTFHPYRSNAVYNNQNESTRWRIPSLSVIRKHAVKLQYIGRKFRGGDWNGQIEVWVENGFVVLHEYAECK